MEGEAAEKDMDEFEPKEKELLAAGTPAGVDDAAGAAGGFCDVPNDGLWPNCAKEGVGGEVAEFCELEVSDCPKLEEKEDFWSLFEFVWPPPLPNDVVVAPKEPDQGLL